MDENTSAGVNIQTGKTYSNSSQNLVETKVLSGSRQDDC